MFFVGEDGEAVGNAINWMDGRAMDMCIKWQEDGTMDRIYDILGSSPYPGTYLCLCCWLAANDPARIQNAKHICMCKDWMKFKLTNDMTMDDSHNELADITARQISPELMELLGITQLRDKVPPIKVALENQAPLDKHIAQQLGLRAGIPVFGGPFDIIACAIGAGNINEGDACAVLGTTCMVEFSQTTANSSPHNIGYTLMHSKPGHWMRAFGVMAGTPNLDWAISNFGHIYEQAAKENQTSVYDEIEKRISLLPPGSEGLVYHPYISPAGERSPFIKPTAKAQYFGISSHHTTDHLLRAIYEGVSYSILDCFDSFEGNVSELRVTGGGSKSRFWCQMIADIIGIDVVVPDGNELGAKGACLVASAALGLYPSLDVAVEKCVQIKERFVPNKENHKIYQKYYKLYKSIITQLWDEWDYRAEIL